MARKGRPRKQAAQRRDPLFDPAMYPALLPALDAFEQVIADLLRVDGDPRPFTSMRTIAIAGFEGEKLSAWRNNLKRGNPTVQASQMLGSLRSAQPTAGADKKFDDAWSNERARERAASLIVHLETYLQAIIGGPAPADTGADAHAATAERVFEPNNAQRAFSRAALALIAANIYVPSEDDPFHPEFPADSPRFPATPTVRLEIGGHTVWVKDESKNPCGTHKDRWAWEMIVRYKTIIDGILSTGRADQLVLPRYSMISSGNAAFALQTLLRTYGLPDLHVVMHIRRCSDRLVDKLRSRGARIYRVDLERKLLSEADVLSITENEDGLDVTTRLADEPFVERFYDWLAYEILNESPKHIFLPFGTGSLFANMIYLLHAEASGRVDQRLLAGASSIRNVSVYGATSDDKKAQMHMLYAPFRPARKGINNAIREFVDSSTLGAPSAIFEVSDDQAAFAQAQLRAHSIRTDLSGAAALALFLKKADSIPRDERALVLATGCLHLPPP